MTIKLINAGLLLILSIGFYACNQSTSTKQAEFYVRGNCGMCEERIETTLKGLDGVVLADWDVETKKIKVTYDTLKLTDLKIQETIANAGHETKNFQSPQAVHDALPECCKKGSSM